MICKNRYCFDDTCKGECTINLKMKNKALKVIREVLNNNKNSILIKNFESEKQWLLKVKLISKNFLKYSDIRLKAFNYAKKHNIDWRVKKLLSFINTN